MQYHGIPAFLATAECTRDSSHFRQLLNRDLQQVHQAHLLNAVN